MRKSISILLFVSLASIDARARREVVDRVVAVIEDEIITERELAAKAEPFLAQLDEVEDEAERETKRKGILKKVLNIEIGERIVEKELEVNRDKLGVTAKDVDRAIEEVIRINNMTRDRLQAALYSQGLTWSEYRKKLREQIEPHRLIQFKVQGKVQVSDADVQRRCRQRQETGLGGEKVCARHILFATKSKADTKAARLIEAKSTQLQAELAAGGDFGAYALKHSDDKSAPDGDLGCFAKGEMVEEFENAAFSIDVGEVSPVVRTEFGFHIIKVYEREAAPTPCEDEESLNPFRNELFQERLEEQMNLWIEDLRKKAFVDIRI